MHLTSLEQQRELMMYMNSLNGWLGHDDDLNRLGLTRGLCKFFMSHIANIHSNLL
jgi:hypothetical protein